MLNHCNENHDVITAIKKNFIKNTNVMLAIVVEIQQLLMVVNRALTFF